MNKKPITKRILAKLGLELHVIRPGKEWMSLPLSGEFTNAYFAYDVANKSYVNTFALHVMWQQLKRCLNLDGDVAQVGVYKGGSAAMMATLVQKTNKTYYLFDTFEGLPKTQFIDNVNGYTETVEKQMADTSEESVKEYLRKFHCVSIHKGLFPDSIPAKISDKFCFVYLDGDLFQTTKDGLDFFWPKLSVSGVIIVDDYGSRRWAGVKIAVDEFIASTHGASLMVISGCQAIITKA